jgi:amino acid transporter
MNSKKIIIFQGIVAGANLSGDLKDPADAIPKGTLLAIALTYVTYMWFAMQTGFVFLREASGVREEYQYYEEYNQEWPTHLWGPEVNARLRGRLHIYNF